MYRPNYSQVSDTSLYLQLAREYPLGTLISAVKGEIDISHLPFIVDIDDTNGDGTVILTSHLAKANPHWQTLNNEVVNVSFQGPNRYISPEIYASKPNVPTWNYAVARFVGRVEVIHDAIEIEEILSKSVTTFEAQYGHKWDYSLPQRFRDQLINEIVGLKIRVERVEGKFKLSQNRSAKDYHSVVDFFTQSPSETDHEMLRWMKQVTAGRQA